MKKICIYGCGMFGFALAKHFGNKYKDDPEYVIISYDRNKDVVNYLNKFKRHPYHHSNVKLHDNNIITSDIHLFIKGCDLLILVVPSQAVREVVAQLKPLIDRDLTIVNTAKSLEINSNKLLSNVIDEEMKSIKYNYSIAQFSGGTLADDLANGAPLGADLASNNIETAKMLQELFSYYNLKTYSSYDLKGVQLAGALKNIISIFAGIVNGLELPYGSETHLISITSKEAKDLALKLGANESTFSMESQSWGNDLWMSCTGNSRNRYFGTLIGKGMSVSQALKQMETEHKITEGYFAAKVIPELCEKMDCEFSILNEIHDILYRGKDCRSSIDKIMEKDFHINSLKTITTILNEDF
jgi:glycerol-3-phosphate dehydrogenase (NAD(P)+)